MRRCPCTSNCKLKSHFHINIIENERSFANLCNNACENCEIIANCCRHEWIMVIKNNIFFTPVWRHHCCCLTAIDIDSRLWRGVWEWIFPPRNSYQLHMLWLKCIPSSAFALRFLSPHATAELFIMGNFSYLMCFFLRRQRLTGRGINWLACNLAPY